MGYNAKNYTEQGGEVTHIGGKLVFDGDNEGGLLENMSTADVTSDIHPPRKWLYFRSS